jgi:PelA/Pel-15E family pectate lyase
VIAFCVAFGPTFVAAADFTQADAGAALKKAVDFFRTKIAVQGGYVYTVSDDLTKREGEERVTPTQVWIQPPSTSTVGEAYLAAYQLTGEKYLLDAARETAECLIQGQLHSGGWYVLIEFDPAARAAEFDYRVDPKSGDKPKSRRFTTLDDNKTQSCLRFLMRLDRELQFKDERLHEATLYGLDHLVGAQFPNGAWPQQFDAPPNPADYPVVKASYPETWSRTFPKVNYIRHYTFNDGSISDDAAVMLEAAEIYGESRYLAAAEKAGDFMILAQMPEPQPAWAQQYDVDMHPAWARKFEPPSITGGESVDIVATLLNLYRATGRDKFLKPVPSALAYLQKSQLPEGGLARFYELQTNKPLYFTKKYELTYSDADLPTHYGFKVGSGKLGQLQAAYDKLKAEGPPAKKTVEKPVIKFSKKIAEEARQVAAALDDRGAWVEDGRMRNFGDDDSTTRVISTRTFVKNLPVLARAAAAK